MCLNRIYVGVLVLVASAQAQQMCLYVLEPEAAVTFDVVSTLGTSSQLLAHRPPRRARRCFSGQHYWRDQDQANYFYLLVSAS